MQQQHIQALPLATSLEGNELCQAMYSETEGHVSKYEFS